MEKLFVGLCVHRDLRAKVFNLARQLERTKDMEVRFHILDGDALIDRSRSRMATHFLENMKSYKAMVFVDDDILYEPETILKQARLLLENDLDIVGATYVTKNPTKPTFTFQFIDGENTGLFGEGAGVREVKYISTGCMAIHRKVLEEMASKNVVHLCDPDGLRFYPFFMPMEYKNANGVWDYLSEDWAFCQRAKNLGFKVHLDCTSKLKHLGDYPYDWDDIVRGPKAVNKTLNLTAIDKKKDLTVSAA